MHSYDVVLLTETWLLDGVNDAELFSDSYTVWRRDRDYASVGQTRGGGVLIAVRRDLAAHARPEWHSTAEDIWISIDIKSKRQDVFKLHIGCLYLCQQNQGLSFSSQLKNFSEQALFSYTNNPQDSFFIAGDFNMSDICWSSNNDADYLTPSFISSNINHNELNDLLNLCDWHQFNHVKNNFDTLLDLIFATGSVPVVHRCTSPLVPEDPYHPALVSQLNFPDLLILKSLTRRKYFYNKGDFTAISHELDNQDWISLLSSGTVDDAVQVFNCLLSSLRDKYVPFKLANPSYYPTWYSRALIKILKEKNKAHRKMKIYGNRSDVVAFSFLRQRAQRVEQECFNNYMTNTELSIRENPKAFWSYIHTNKQHNAYPSVMSYNGDKISDGESICNAFAEFFKSNFLEPDVGINIASVEQDERSAFLSVRPDISTVEITDHQVYLMLKNLQCNMSAGPDGLHPLFISRCANSLAFPIAFLFRRSLKEATVPMIWKTALVTPIHKKGPKCEISNFRPISKLCVLAKIFEKLIHQQIYEALKHTLLPQQHGFIKGRSTVSNLVAFTEAITSGMQSGGQVDAIYTDYTKAFDRIDHVILLKKLNLAGIHGDLLRWFSSYVSNRSQTVVLNGFSSHQCFSAIPSGVPQGSILGPLLFVLFTNDIVNCFHHSQFLLFADDMKIYKKINSLHDCILLQEDLDRLHIYCLRNKLDLNISKCNCISFSRSKNNVCFNYNLNQQSLTRTDFVRDLGVIMDSKLLYDKHIDAITSKAFKMLGFIIRTTKHFKMAKSHKILYCSLVRSQLEYASQVWNPKYDIYTHKIERIQKKFLKFLNFKHKINVDSDYENICRHHHLLPLTLRREASDLTLLLHLLNARIDSGELLSMINMQVPPRINTRRNHLKFHVNSYVANYRSNSYFNRVFDNFNRKYSEYTDILLAKPNYFKNLINKIFFNM